MASKIYTYFGDYLLGLFVEWNLAGSNSGTTDVELTLTQNLRSKLHVYGYGSVTATEVVSATYGDGGTILADYNETDLQFTKDNNVFIGYIGSTTTNTDLAVAPTASFPSTATEAERQTEIYHFYLAWQNPDATGAVTYDGMEIKAYAEVTPPVFTVAANVADGTTTPTLTVKLQNNKKADYVDPTTENCNANDHVDNVCFDIHPGSAYAYGTAAADQADGIGVENIELDATNVADTTDICTEKWYLSPTAIACVEMQVKLKRKRNTGDTAHDIILDFSNTYTMHAMVGRVADKSDETLKFETIAVDFAQLQTTGALGMVSASAPILAAIVYTLSF